VSTGATGAWLILHGERAGGRAVGPPTVLPLPAPDLYSNEPTVAVAKLARLALLSGAWRTAPKTGGVDAKGDYLLGIKVPAALLFPPAARHALLRRPPARGCHWCVARMLAALDSQPDPIPTDPLKGFLGKPCASCRQAHALNARVAEVRAEFAAEVASGRRRPRPPASRAARPARGRQVAPAAMLAAGAKPPVPDYWRPRVRPVASANPEEAAQLAQLQRRADRMYQAAMQARQARLRGSASSRSRP
jgi:hypothetical protein